MKRAQVQRPLRLLAAVGKLPRDAEPVLRVPLHRLLVLRRRRAVEEIEAQRAVLDAMPQHVNRAAPGDLSLQPGEELLPRDVFRSL